MVAVMNKESCATPVALFGFYHQQLIPKALVQSPLQNIVMAEIICLIHAKGGLHCAIGTHDHNNDSPDTAFVEALNNLSLDLILLDR